MLRQRLPVRRLVVLTFQNLIACYAVLAYNFDHRPAGGVELWLPDSKGKRPGRASHEQK